MQRLTAVWRTTAVFMLATIGALADSRAARGQGIVEYRFTGSVIDNSGNLGVFGPHFGVDIGDTITGHFSYLTGPANPDQEPGDPQLGIYNLVDFVIDQSTVPITPTRIGVIHEPGLATLPPTPPDLGSDRFSVAGTIPFGTETKSVSLTLSADYGAVWSDDSLPTSLALGDFDLGVVRAVNLLGLAPDGMSKIDAAELTALVPEPTGLALALVGLVMVGLANSGRVWQSEM